MKKIIYILILFALGCSAVFAQAPARSKTVSGKSKLVSKTAQVRNAQTQTAEREKFDPKRIAADDLQNAVSKAAKEDKRIVLDVGGEWCGWCIHMDKFIAANTNLKKLRDDNFVWVKINMSEENENKEFLSKYPEITGYPHLFVLEKDGSLLKSKDTSELEDGKTYNLQKFVDFLTEYKSVKN